MWVLRGSNYCLRRPVGAKRSVVPRWPQRAPSATEANVGLSCRRYLAVTSYFALLLLGSLSLTVFGDAAAMTCRKISPKQAALDADLIFSGIVVSRPSEHPAGAARRPVVVLVDALWKGHLTADTVLVWGLGPRPNAREPEPWWLVYARYRGQELVTTICYRTATAERCAADVAYLGEPTRRPVYPRLTWFPRVDSTLHRGTPQARLVAVARLRTLALVWRSDALLLLHRALLDTDDAVRDSAARVVSLIRGSRQ
jgi:hypothetical protein